MGIERYRDARDMPRPPRPGGAKLVEAIAAAWERAHLRGPPDIPVGVARFRSLEEAQEARRDLARRRLRRLRRPIREVDGGRFDDLDGFWDEVSRQLVPGTEWGRNLDAFNDILRGGFGTPDGFVLRWLNAERSRRALGYQETVRWLERKLERCHPDNADSVERELAAALSGEGPTLFDLLVEIIRSHGEGGDEAEDGVELQLV